MPLNDAQRKTLILTQVGDQKGRVISADLWPAVWQRAQDRAALIAAATAATYERLVDLYARLECIDVLLGSVRAKVTATTETGMSMRRKELSDNLQAMRAELLTELETVAAQTNAAGGEGGAVVDRLTTVSPVDTSEELSDPNSLDYAGRPDRFLLPVMMGE